MIGERTHLQPERPGPIVLESASWAFYDQFLSESRDSHLRVTYNDGRMEIMSPLPKHGRLGHLVARLVETLCEERDIELLGYEDTTFRSEKEQKGLEPDKCYYVQNVEASRGMDDAFDPAIHVPPDLAIEVEVTRRLVPREPIYVALGVPELWRVTVGDIRCRHLVGNAEYLDRQKSLAFPFLEPAELWPWVDRLRMGRSVTVLREFRAWVRQLT
jgi:Uma2 family endonuclease